MNKTLMGFALCLAIFAGCAVNNQVVRNEAPKTDAPVTAAVEVPDVKLLFGFEDDKEIASLYKENDDTRDYPIEKVTENATQGKYAIKISFPEKGSWPGPHFIEFSHDWSGYDLLKFDVYNPTKQIVKVGFAGADADANFTEKNYFGEYAKRFGSERVARPGKNTIELDIGGLVVEDGSRPVNFSNLKRFGIYMSSRPANMVLYLDNIRLEKNKEE